MVNTIQQSELMQRLLKEKEVARKFQERRHIDWNDNYELYRNKVQTNRLTQRQAINVPLMKETVKTLLSKIDEPPTIEWKELSGDKEKELIFAEKWNTDYDRLNIEGIDIQDKKTCLMYGRPFMKLNYSGGFMLNALDIYDVVIDPLVNSLDIETARFLIHQNIFRSLKEVLADDRYSAIAKQRLKTYLSSKDAIIQSDTNKIELEKKQKRLLDMGVMSQDFNRWSAGDVLVNISEHYSKYWNKNTKQWEWGIYVYADDAVTLMSISLKKALGVDFLPFITWGEDIETQDIWNDSVADLVRNPNKILNVWMSQMSENRTLKNFQMHWYSPIGAFTPQTYEPGPGRMLPAPAGEDIRKTIMPVEVSGLEDCMAQIEFLIGLVEKGTGATSTEKGELSQQKTTLGEVELAVGKAMERTQSMTKFYRRSREELATKYYRIMDANEDKSTKQTLYKTSSKGTIWPKDIMGKDWKSEAGYKAIVRSTSEQENDTVKDVQKWVFIKNQFPNNLVLQKIAQKRLLDLGDLTAEELREVEEFEKNQMLNPPMAQQAQPQQQPQPQQIPEQALGELQSYATS